jgi:hypothetical protein
MDVYTFRLVPSDVEKESNGCLVDPELVLIHHVDRHSEDNMVEVRILRGFSHIN